MFKHRKELVVNIICFLAIIFALQIQFSSVKALTNEDKDKIILIDAGHGGIDGGAVSNSGTIEKDINLSISLKLKDILNKQGYKVIMTREEDKGLYTNDGKIRKKKIEDLNNRLKMKNESKCDMFISIHLNMFPESKYRGAQVWYGSNNNSEKLAKIIQDNFKKNINDGNKRIEKPAGKSYKILLGENPIPQVIVECGFLSNYNEEQLLKSQQYQLTIADIISKSINEYYQK
ncbi:MAG: N-acetylmuramoyl-L-alanine amidase CwlD [Clostridiaceae bacterium]|jgi:N-acetylmuramoyl-L-alanine amidase|nr:N-acetylmuramoyl-L-alanine amidase CwlD [Clostridiaceae bacterium]